MNKNIKTPAAPPVYRPQPVPKVLQRKEATVQSPPAVGPKHTPAAPPVYRPQPAPKVLQAKPAQIKAVAVSAQPNRLPQAGPNAATNHSAIQPKMQAPSSNVVQLKGKCIECNHKHGSVRCTTNIAIVNEDGTPGTRECGCMSHSSHWGKGAKFNPGSGKRERKLAAITGNG
jgi:hypothetical protein